MPEASAAIDDSLREQHEWVDARDRSLIGRSTLIETVKTLLREQSPRLITLTGPGGVGKTRVATAIGEEHGSATFVSLASIQHATHVLPAIGAALGIEGAGGAPMISMIGRTLNESRSLLILDNLEQIAGVADEIAYILAKVPLIQIVATSRGALKLDVEREVPVPPFPVDEPSTVSRASDLHSPATQLFIERATAGNHHFAVSDANAGAVASICERLDGLPLAIELAAARCRYLSVDALLLTLDDRLNAVSGGPAGNPKRHQSLRETIQWSYELLDERQQRFFLHISIFRGGFSFEAAQAISGIQSIDRVLDLISALCDQSLLVKTTDANNDPRFTMLETVRAFGVELLTASSAEAAIRDKHAQIFIELAETGGPRLKDRSEIQTLWWNRLVADIANFRAAIEWLRAQHQPGRALRIVERLDWFWTEITFVDEGRRLLADLMAFPHEETEPEVLANANMIASMLADVNGDATATRAFAEESLRLWKVCGRDDQAARALYVLANGAFEESEFTHTKDLANQCLASAEAIGDEWFIAAAHVLLGITLSYGFQRYEESVAHAEIAVRVFREIGEHSRINGALVCVADSSFYLGDLARCWESCQAALEIETQSSNDLYYVHSILRTFGQLADRLGDSTTAIKLISASVKRERETGVITRKPSKEILRELEGTIRSRVGEAAYLSAWREGQELPLSDAIALARSIPSPRVQTVPAAFSTLSRRELEVLRLLASGKSDQEISDELFISRKTASQHVSSVLRKLDLSSRTAAGTMAAKLGLS